jgi:sec-independent protein translocase protein TatC
MAGMDENPYKSPASDQPDDRTVGSRALDKIDELFELRNWRIGVMICVVIAAFVTPADPFSLFFIAVPLVVVYFIGVGVRAWLNRDESS